MSAPKVHAFQREWPLYILACLLGFAAINAALTARRFGFFLAATLFWAAALCFPPIARRVPLPTASPVALRVALAVVPIIAMGMFVAATSPTDDATDVEAVQASIYDQAKGAVARCDSGYRTVVEGLSQIQEGIITATQGYQAAVVGQEWCNNAVDNLGDLKPQTTSARAAVKVCEDAYSTKALALYQMAKIINGARRPSDVSTFQVISQEVARKMPNCAAAFEALR